MDQKFMDEIDDGFELEEYRDSVYVRLAKTEQCNRELEAENRRLSSEVTVLKTGDIAEAYAAGEQKIIDLLAAANARVKKLKEELADVFRCSGDNSKAIERAAYLLSAVELFIAKNPVSDYLVFYDEVFCDGECLREDCRVAKEELERMLAAKGPE